MRGHDDVGDIRMLNGMTEEELTERNRDVFGASYYWVMDLAGSLWEKTITIGAAEGRQYQGSHGDGVLNENGQATNMDWPARDQGADDTAGYGYRGGGFYWNPRIYHEFNPHSPVGYRPFGSWAGNARHRAYGMRGVRSAN